MTETAYNRAQLLQKLEDLRQTIMATTVGRPLGVVLSATLLADNDKVTEVNYTYGDAQCVADSYERLYQTILALREPDTTSIAIDYERLEEAWKRAFNKIGDVPAYHDIWEQLVDMEGKR